LYIHLATLELTRTKAGAVPLVLAMTAGSPGNEILAGYSLINFQSKLLLIMHEKLLFKFFLWRTITPYIYHIQWNLSKAVTFGPEIFGLYRELATYWHCNSINKAEKHNNKQEPEATI